MSFWYKSAENRHCHPNCSCQAECQGPWTSCSDFQKPCVSKTAVFRVNDTSRSLCDPVYVVIVFHLVKQSTKPLGFLLLFLGRVFDFKRGSFEPLEPPLATGMLFPSKIPFNPMHIPMPPTVMRLGEVSKVGMCCFQDGHPEEFWNLNPGWPWKGQLTSWNLPPVAMAGPCISGAIVSLWLGCWKSSSGPGWYILRLSVNLHNQHHISNKLR